MSDWRQRFACDTCADHRPSDRAIARYRCERCGRSLRFTPPAAGRVDEHRGGPWRYAAWLPCDTHAELDPGNAIGVVPAPALARELGVRDVWLVDCTGLGTGTFKDLEAQVNLAAAADLRREPIALFSTGNTARAYHEWARRLDLECAVIVARSNLAKLQGCAATARQTIVTIDAPAAEAATAARRMVAADGTHRVIDPEWKVEGKAAVAYAIAEHCPDADLIVQTVGAGYGPIGYELGFARARHIDVFSQAAVVRSHRFLLVQPADAALLARAWNDPAHHPPDSGELPADPFEPTLQSTNAAQTFPLLRRLPIDDIRAIAPERVVAQRGRIDALLSAVGIHLDFAREHSSHIALASLLERPPAPERRVAIVITGSAPFSAGM